jgi:DNA polymerase III gamma/tau subunit
VLGVLGAVDREALARMVDAFAREDPAAALRELHGLLFGGSAPEDFADQLGEYLRDLLVAGYCGADDPMLAGAAADPETLKAQAELFSADQLTYMLQLLREAKLRARRDTTGRIALELAAIKMARLSDLVPLTEALDRLGCSGSGCADRAAPAATSGLADSAGPSRPAGNAVAAASLARLKQHLKKGPARAGEQSRPPAPAAPDGLPEEKFRQMVDCADSPDTAREAMADGVLRTAFVEGDKALGMNPVKLERAGGAEDASEPEGHDGMPDEVDD